MSDSTALRSEFLLDPTVTFLNHGSFGAVPREVFERYQEWQLELERQPVLFLARRLEELLGEARAALGAYVGADADDLVFVPNASSGVNIAAWPLGLGPGDEVLSTDLEYGALDLTWEHVCGDFGARYVRAPIRLPVASAEEVVETIWTGVGPRTKVLFISHYYLVDEPHTRTRHMLLKDTDGICDTPAVWRSAYYPGGGSSPKLSALHRAPFPRERARKERGAMSTLGKEAVDPRSLDISPRSARGSRDGSG